MLTTAVAPVTMVGSPMRQRQPRRPGPEDAGLVDELEVRRDRPLGEVDRDVRQPDADEADVLAGSSRAAHDHHLGLAEGRVGHGTPDRETACRARRRDHPVAPSDGRRSEARVAASGPLGDRVEDLVEVPVAGRLLDERQREPLPMTGRWPRGRARARPVIASTLPDPPGRRPSRPVRPGDRIISGSLSGTPVVDEPDGAGPGRAAIRSAQLLEVGRPAVEVVDPLAQPGLGRRLVAGDRVPVEVEPVVAVVGALDVRRMRAPRLDDDGVDDEARDDRPVRVGPDDRLVDELLDDDDDPLGGEGRLLLAAEQAPDLGVAAGRGALGVDDRRRPAGAAGRRRSSRRRRASAIGRMSGLATGRSVSK